MKRILSLSIKLISLLLFFITAFTQITNAQSANNQSEDKDWIGSYEFFDGQTGGPTDRQSDFITYKLVVSQNGNSLIARLTADGVQTSDEYECSIELSGNSIKIFFAEDLNGMNNSRFKPFKKGDLLFTLIKTQIGKKTRYLFRSGDYEILPLSAISKNRIYFDKKSK